MILDLLNWGLKLGVVTTGLLGLVLLLRRPLARFGGAEAAYLIWALPILRLVMPELNLTLPQKVDAVPWPDFSADLWPAAEPVPAAIDAVAAPAVNTGLDMSVLPLVIISVWIGVGIIWFSRHIIRHLRYRHMLDHISAEDRDALGAVSQEAADIIGLRKLPPVKIAPAAIGPIVSGMLRPLIIVPENFTTDFSRQEQLYALCHEMAHVKRRDLWGALALLIFRAVHWYNPLAHYAARKFSLDQESACDAFLMAKLKGHHAHDYAQLLLKAERSHAGYSPQSLSLALVKKRAAYFESLKHEI